MLKNFRLEFIFLLLIVTNQINCQNLSLEVVAEDKIKTSIIDSIGYQTSFNNYNSLETELNNLKSKLTRIGFIETTLDSMLKQNDSLFKAHLFLGPRIHRIRILYDSKFDTELLNFLNHAKGDGYFELDIAQLEASLKELNSKIAEQGDPFSTLQLINLRKESNKIVSELSIQEKQKRSIDKIVVKGYEKFPQSYIKRFLKLKTGSTFNLEDIKAKTQLLEELNFANQIKEPEVLFTNDSTTLYVYVEKNQSNNFDGFLGFGTNENTGNIEFDGYLNLLLSNNLNFGESLSLLYKSDEIDQQTFDVKLDMPFVFGSAIGLDLGLTIFRKDSTFTTATQNVNLRYQINAQQNIALGVRAVNSNNLLDNDTAILNDYTSNHYTLNYSFRKSQYYDPLFPINLVFDFTASIGERERDGSTQNQNALNLEAYKIFNLNNRNSLFLRITGASLISDDYLDNELYRFGGINSIRGFEENSLVGNLYTVLNTEYRYRLSNTIYVHSVFDAAYTENQITDSKTKLFGFGFGFGLLTQAGLFRFNYTSGKTENRPFRFADSKIHVSLTATF